MNEVNYRMSKDDFNKMMDERLKEVEDGKYTFCETPEDTEAFLESL
ncbi:MAG: hypothetical protein ACK5IQ_06460 [Bacteroidales bacterium]